MNIEDILESLDQEERVFVKQELDQLLLDDAVVGLALKYQLKTQELGGTIFLSLKEEDVEKAVERSIKNIEATYRLSKEEEKSFEHITEDLREFYSHLKYGSSSFSATLL